MAASDTPDSRSASDSEENTSARPPAPEDAQLSTPNGVSTNVSSVAMDRGLLGRGLPSFAGARPSAPVAVANSTVSTGDVSDVDVMLRVKTGDESAFAYLVQKYRRPMIGFMYRLCHNPSTAEELAQEVFLRVYRSRSSYEPTAKFTTWL
jgi:RNA polymerase sigma-70 factor, ECF subfamily